MEDSKSSGDWSLGPGGISRSHTGYKEATREEVLLSPAGQTPTDLASVLVLALASCVSLDTLLTLSEQVPQI